MKKFHKGEQQRRDDQLDDKFKMPFKERKRSAHLYQGTANLHVEQEFLIWLLKIKANYPIVCLADKFLGSYDHSATKVCSRASLATCLPAPLTHSHDRSFGTL